MTDLLISILCSYFLFVCFRLFPKYNVDVAQAIVVNYFVAFTCGCLVEGQFPSLEGTSYFELGSQAMICGSLFISLFIVMGISSQKNGVGSTAVATKMSLALTTLYFIYSYGEHWNWMKGLGIATALYSIWLIFFTKAATRSAEKIRGGKESGLLLLIVLFVGTAFMDGMLNQSNRLALETGVSVAAFSAWSFLFAGIIGIVFLIIRSFRIKRSISKQSILAGIILGIPNYFSIYLLVKAYRTAPWSDAIVLSIAGISVTALTAIAGMIIFNESTAKKKLLGLLMATLAILLLTLG